MTPEDEIKKVATEMAGLIDDLRKTHDQKIANEIKGLGVGELKASVDKMHERLDKLDDVKTSLDKQVAEIKRTRAFAGEMLDADGETKVAKPADFDEVKAAFKNFLRTGDNAGVGTNRDQKVPFQYRAADGKKAMSVISDPDGGFTVMPDTNGRIRKLIFETSPILSVCDVQTISTDALEGVIDDQEASVGWVGETTSRTETNTPQIGIWRIPMQEIYAMPKATQKLLDDSQWDIEKFLVDKVSDKMSREINYQCLRGISPRTPRGVLTYPAGTDFRTQVEQINMGDANLVTADGLIAIQDGLKDAFRANAKWAFNRKTRRAIRVLKDSYGRYLLEPGLAMGTPSTVLGDEYVIMQDMPDVAANALPIVYADWKQFYQAVERQGMRILRDPYTSKGYVLFYVTRRFSGDVHNHEAGKIGKVSV
jgi:HK97 family phage major capsid protein